MANRYNKTIRVSCEEVGMIDLVPDQKFSFRAKMMKGDDPIHCYCSCDVAYTDVIPYDPGRDKYQPDNIYWKSGKGGFYMSYDQTHWKLESPWDYE